MKSLVGRYVWLPLLVSALVLNSCGASAPSKSSKSPLNIAVVAGFTGSQAPSASMWIAGIQQATSEINKQGGILGHPVKISKYDFQSEPALSLAEMRKALQSHPYVVMGTILSSATLINYSILQQAGVPQFSGSVAPTINAKNPTSLFSTEPNSTLEAKMFADWSVQHAKVKRVDIVYANDSFGASGLQSFASTYKDAGADVTSEISTSVGETNFSGAVAKIQQDNPDAVFMYMHETETGKFLVQANAAGLEAKIRFLGASSALSPATLAIAGAAANGVDGFVPFTAAAPKLQALGADFAKKNGGTLPDHNYYKGYVGLWAVDYATTAVGKVNQKAMNKWLHKRTLCANKYPHLLGNTYWSSNGNLDINGYIVKVENGKQVMDSMTPPPSPSNLASCGKSAR